MSIGSYDPVSVDRFLAVRIACLVIIPVGLILIFFVFNMTGLMALVLAVLVVLIALMGPEAWLNRKVDERKAEIQRSLPDILDLLVISVEAGLGFEQALDRTVAAVPGALSQEFSRMLGETRAGATRSDAMRALEARVDVPEVRSFVLAILQADTFGVSIGRVLRAQAEEMRIKRRQLAQERAQKAPVKMLHPDGVLHLPGAVRGRSSARPPSASPTPSAPSSQQSSQARPCRPRPLPSPSPR